MMPRPAEKSEPTMMPESTSVTGGVSPLFRARKKESRTAVMPARKAESCPLGKRAGNTMARAAPQEAPAETPRMYGSTRGFLKHP